MRSLFGARDSSLERSSQGKHILFDLIFIFGYMSSVVEPKKRPLGPQNDPASSGPEKP
jgi:hypothetical protein